MMNKHPEFPSLAIRTNEDLSMDSHCWIKRDGNINVYTFYNSYMVSIISYKSPMQFPYPLPIPSIHIVTFNGNSSTKSQIQIPKVLPKTPKPEF